MPPITGCGRVIHGRVLARRELSPTGTSGAGHQGVRETEGMSNQVSHDEAGWHLRASPPDTVETMTATVGTPTEALATLSSWGCRSTDATDALYEADPLWARTHDEEVMRRRANEER